MTIPGPTPLPSSPMMRIHKWIDGADRWIYEDLVAQRTGRHVDVRPRFITEHGGPGCSIWSGDLSPIWQRTFRTRRQARRFIHDFTTLQSQ